jgi:uroporphyrinogen-III synthase
MQRVLLARADRTLPEAQQALEQRGFSVVPAPVLTLRPESESVADRATAQRLDQFDAVIVISDAAAELGLKRLEACWPQWPLHPRWYAVGVRSARPLQARGLVVTVPSPETTEGLLALPALAAAREILLLKGAGGRPTLEASLKARGQKVTVLSLYARLAVPCALPPPASIDVVVVGSGECLEALLAAGGQGFRGKALLAPSERVAELAWRLGFQKAQAVRSLAPETLAEALARLSRVPREGDNESTGVDGELR